MLLQRVPEPGFQVQPVTIASAVPFPLEDTGLFQLGDDALDRPLRDTDL